MSTKFPHGQCNKKEEMGLKIRDQPNFTETNKRFPTGPQCSWRSFEVTALRALGGNLASSGD